MPTQISNWERPGILAAFAAAFSSCSYRLLVVVLVRLSSWQLLEGTRFRSWTHGEGAGKLVWTHIWSPELPLHGLCRVAAQA